MPHTVLMVDESVPREDFLNQPPQIDTQTHQELAISGFLSSFIARPDKAQSGVWSLGMVLSDPRGGRTD